jgi:hypothetical protein
VRWTSDRLHDAHADASGPRPRLLLLCDHQPDNAATIIDHIEAIRAWSRNDVFVLPMLRDLPDDLDLDAFDGLVIHYNLVMADSGYVSPLARWRIAQFRGVKGAFIQDEYRFVDQTVSVMRMLGIQVLFTIVPEDRVHLIYPSAALPRMRRIVTMLTGYVPDGLLQRAMVPWADRRIDVGYRARRLPVWLGRLAEEKWKIAERFAADAPAWGLSVDVSCREEDRLYGEAWIDFIGHSRAMLGVESGASVVDFDGSLEASIRAWRVQHPDTTDDELHARFLSAAEGNVRMNIISPRCFEAAALGTLMVLYPGAYSGILEAWRHYVPLEKDHSNMAEVVAAIRDRDAWERITGHARREVAENPAWSFRSVAESLDAALGLEPRTTRSLTAESFEGIAGRSLEAMAELQPLPPRSSRRRRLRRLATRLRRLLPSPTAVATFPGQANAGWAGLRRRVRHGRALAWWLLHPRLVPSGRLLRGGAALLADLCQLRLVQEMGARAAAAGVPSPFVLLLDRSTAAARIVDRDAIPAGAPQASPVSGDLSWARSIGIDIANPWLVPIGMGPARGVSLAALSELMLAHPGVAGRAIAGSLSWCAVVELA